MKIIKLKDKATVEISGVDKKTKEGELPVRLCNFVDVYYNWAITNKLSDSFMEATAKPSEIEKFKIKKGQVALTKDSETRDDIGISTYIAEEFDNVVLGYHNALVTPNPEALDGKYLNALFHTDYAKKYFAFSASGSGQRYALGKEIIESFPLPDNLPSIEEQRRIGEVFSTLDQKILLNKSINQNLELMITEITNWMFLYKKSNIAKQKIGDIGLIKAGGDCPIEFSKEKRENFIIPIYSNGTENEGLYGYTTNAIVKKRSITVAARGTIGYCVRRNAGYVPIIRLLAVIPNFIGGDIYLHQIISRLKFKKSGSVQQQLTVPELSEIIVPYPSERDLFKYNLKTFPLVEIINHNNIEIVNLIKLRDELLTLLMNGQVSVNSDLSND